MHPILLASAAIDKLKKAGSAYGGSSSGVESGAQLAGIIGSIVSYALSLLGVVFLVLIVYAGYNYLMAGGDEGKVETAKHTMTRAVIGLAIVLAAYAIAKFVVPALMCATGTGACGEVS